MNCPICLDKGLMRVRYHDGSPDDFGVCRCAAGQSLRAMSNPSRRRAGWPLWTVMVATMGIPSDRVSMVEEILDDDDLARIPTADPTEHGPSIASAMQTRRPRL